MSLPVYIVELMKWNKQERKAIQERMYSFNEDSRKAARDMMKQMVNYGSYLECFGYHYDNYRDVKIDDELGEIPIPYDEWKDRVYNDIPDFLKKLYENGSTNIINELMRWYKRELKAIHSRIQSSDISESDSAWTELTRHTIKYRQYLECFGYHYDYSDSPKIDEELGELPITYGKWRQEQYKNIPEHLRIIYENTRHYKR